ncbi:hypothetical protein P3S67_015495 [Capsicum chacoense]
MPHPEPKSCIFEHLYFALPNSVVFGRSGYESRRAFGEILATEAPVECDVVIAVPEHIYFALPNSVVHINTYFEQNFNCAYRSGVESSEWCGIAVI